MSKTLGQGDSLLLKKRERAARGKGPVPASATALAPRAREAAAAASAATPAASVRYTDEELADKREVEACLKEIYDSRCTMREDGAVGMTYDGYVGLLRALRVFDGVADARHVLEKTRPPDGCLVTWADFNICLKIVALNKYPDAEVQEAVDRLVVEAVAVWVGGSMGPEAAEATVAHQPQLANPRGMGAPAGVNGIGDVSVPEEAFAAEGLMGRGGAGGGGGGGNVAGGTAVAARAEERQATPAAHRQGARRARPAQPAKAAAWVPPEMQMLFGDFCARAGDDARDDAGRAAASSWQAFARERVLGAECGALVAEESVADAWRQHCPDGCPDLEAFSRAVVALGCAVFPHSQPQVAEQLVVQLALNAMGKPLGLSGDSQEDGEGR